MAETLAAHLDGLQHELRRLEQLLMLDANWRTLCELKARLARKSVGTSDATAQIAELEASLAENRLYVARCKIAEAIELLEGWSMPAHNGPAGARAAPRRRRSTDG